MRRFLLALVLPVLLWPAALVAAPRIDALYDALGLSEVVEIMRDEGMVYGGELANDLFAGRGVAGWDNEVARLYDIKTMERVLRDELESELTGTDLDPLVAFFTSENGRRIVQLEITARRALLDEDVEADSRDRLGAMIRDRDPRLEQLERFAAVNDLVDYNVMGALNANYAFYTGLALGGAFPEALSESQILNDVWSQEAEIRLETQKWLFSYLALAYRPLATDDLDAYIAFSETEGGQALNRALFAAFDAMFVDISDRLGRAAARHIGGQEL